MSKDIYQHSYQRHILIPNPGAGNEWNWQAPQICRLWACLATLTTAAGGPNRFPGLKYTDPVSGQTAWVAPPQGGFSIAPASSQIVAALPGAVLGAFPVPGHPLLQGSVLESFTGGLAAGDTYTTISILIET